MNKIGDIIKVTRVLEYEGPAEWINETLLNSQAGVPLQGERTFGGGVAVIRSGMVTWQEQPAAAPAPPPKPTTLADASLAGASDDVEVEITELPAPPAPSSSASSAISIRPFRKE